MCCVYMHISLMQLPGEKRRAEKTVARYFRKFPVNYHEYVGCLGDLEETMQRNCVDKLHQSGYRIRTASSKLSMTFLKWKITADIEQIYSTALMYASLFAQLLLQKVR